MSTIQQIHARQILDARGCPTIECSLWLSNGASVTTSVPSGTSTGKYEAKELRDGDANFMLGLGVTKAVASINDIIAPALIGKDPANQTEADQLMVNLDGTMDKSKLGANAILAVSQAILKAGALDANLSLYNYIQQKYNLTDTPRIPTCIFSVIEGGKHGAENLDIQEFEIIPASHLEYSAALNLAVTIYRKIKEVLIMKGAIHSTGLNGGFAPNLFNNTDAFEIIIEAIKATPYIFAQDVFLGADISATSFHEAGKYSLKDRSQALSSKELAKYYKSLKDLYHVFYIEDPFQEDDESSWKEMTAEFGATSMIVGDKLLVTSLEKTTRAIGERLCNSITVKPNQTGTVSETIEVIKIAKESGWQVVCSHRSGETNDDFIADLAVGTGVQYVKFGPPNRGERISKYNRLLTIEAELKANILSPVIAPAPEVTSAMTQVPAVAPTPEMAVAPTLTPTPEPMLAPEPMLTPEPMPVIAPIPTLETTPVLTPTPEPAPVVPEFNDPNIITGTTQLAQLENDDHPMTSGMATPAPVPATMPAPMTAGANPTLSSASDFNPSLASNPAPLTTTTSTPTPVATTTAAANLPLGDSGPVNIDLNGEIGSPT